jgi:hypothetical protein
MLNMGKPVHSNGNKADKTHLLPWDSKRARGLASGLVMKKGYSKGF